jgi:hypothetical protein
VVSACAITVQFAIAVPSALAFSCSVDASGQIANIALDASDTGLEVFIRSGTDLFFDNTACGNVTTLHRVNVNMHKQPGYRADQ